MSRGSELLLLIPLTLGIVFVWCPPSRADQINRLEVIDVSRDYALSERRRDIGRPFDESTRCSGKRSATTIRELLGADAKTIHVHRYDKAAWSSIAIVTEYIHRIIAGPPETRELLRNVHWAEMKLVEIEGTVEFASGRKSRIEFANGYAHIEDDSGCEWWGRYLGACCVMIINISCVSINRIHMAIRMPSHFKLLTIRFLGRSSAGFGWGVEYSAQYSLKEPETPNLCKSGLYKSGLSVLRTRPNSKVASIRCTPTAP